MRSVPQTADARVGAAEATLALWSAIFGDGKGYLCVASGKRDGRRLGNFKERYFRYPEEVGDAAGWCTKQSQEGREVYFCAHLLTEPRRAKETAAPVRALYADGDRAGVPEVIPEPSVVVESSPGRTQLYWTLTEAVEPEAAERLSKRLAYAMGADKSGWDLTQLLRVPGTANRKYPDAPAVVLREVTGEIHDPTELGDTLPDVPGRKGERLAEPKSPPMSDEEVLACCRQATDAERFSVLFDDGDTECYHGGDHSAADAGLCWILGYYTQDEEQIDRLFRRSALMREKWNRRDYRERTIRFVLPEDRDYYGAEREWPTVIFVDDLEDENGTGEAVTPVTSPSWDESTPTTGARDTRDTVTPTSGTVRPPTPGLPPFPVDALPPSLTRFVLEAAHAKECPPDFVALPVLAALGVAVGASRRAEISRTYHEPAIVWTAVVAPPASGKTPAEDAALLPVIHQQRLYNYQHELALKEYEEKYQEWEQEANEARKKKKRVPPEPEKPVKKRIRVGDTTLEALMLRLVENPRGLILTRDELAGFFNSLNQYRGKGADREVWLSLHSGKAPPLDRKSSDESYDIDYPAVSMCGGIQPGKLKVLDIEAGDGMVERFLFAWPEATLLPEAERDISLEAEAGYRRVWERLHALEMGEDAFGKPAPVSVPLTPGAQGAYRIYKRALKEESYEPGVSEFMQGVLGKMVIYLARFSLILALVRVAEGEDGSPEEVERGDVDAAYDLVSYFVSHSQRLHAEVQEEDKKAVLARALGKLLEQSGGIWKGSATELYERLKSTGYGHLLPKTPDNLTPQVTAACRSTPALTAERGRTRNEGRWIEIRWARPVGGGDRS